MQVTTNKRKIQKYRVQILGMTQYATYCIVQCVYKVYQSVEYTMLGTACTLCNITPLG